MNRTELENIFLFIAHQLEGYGYDKRDIPTVYGITQKNYPELYNMLKENPTDDNIIKAYQHIYEKHGCDRFAFPLNISFFDAVFNMGGKEASIILQKTLNNFGAHLIVDGIIGRKTMQAYQTVIQTSVENWLTFNMFQIIRRKTYLIMSPSYYRCGWINRCNKLEEYITLYLF